MNVRHQRQSYNCIGPEATDAPCTSNGDNTGELLNSVGRIASVNADQMNAPLQGSAWHSMPQSMYAQHKFCDPMMNASFLKVREITRGQAELPLKEVKGSCHWSGAQSQAPNA